MKDSDKPSMLDTPPGNPFTESVVSVETPPGNVTRERIRRAKVKRYIKWSFLTVCCLFTMVVGTVFGLFMRSEAFRQLIGGWKVGTQLIHPLDPFASYNPQDQFTSDKQHAINVLLLGCDVDYEDRRPVELKNTRGRSDSIMIARLDFDKKTINILSVPRDTAVNIPEHGLHKINAAHAYGGAELTQATIRDTFGINTDYYVALNYDAFRNVVDEIGGVDLMVHKELNYDDNWGNLHIHLNPGFQHLTGYRAMGYVRYRHKDNDLARAERQHEFLEALKYKATRPATFSKLPGVLDAIFNNLESNMTVPQLMTLANFSRQLPKENIHLETLPAREAKNFVYLDPVKSEEVIRRMFFNNNSAVAVKILDRSTISERFPSSKKKSRRGANSEEQNIPRDDNGDPLQDQENDRPGNSKVTPHSTPNDSGSKTEPGESGDMPKTRQDPKPDENKGDGDKPGGGGKSGGEGKDNNTKPAPGGEMIG